MPRKRNHNAHPPLDDYRDPLGFQSLLDGHVEALQVGNYSDQTLPNGVRPSAASLAGAWTVASLARAMSPNPSSNGINVICITSAVRKTNRFRSALNINTSRTFARGSNGWPAKIFCCSIRPVKSNFPNSAIVYPRRSCRRSSLERVQHQRTARPSRPCDVGNVLLNGDASA